jgi:hypothetical protein
MILVGAIGCGDDPVAPASGPTSEPLSFSNFHEASVVVGQVGMTSKGPNASGTIGAQGFDDPWSPGAGTGPYYVADMGNNRILGFTEIPASNGAIATFVLGQPDFTSDASGTSAQTFNAPIACAVYNRKLFLVDFFNNRVLIWNSLPTTNVPADVVIGQPDFVTGPAGSVSRTRMFLPTDVTAVEGKLIVADRSNNRILIWESIPSVNGAPADVVVGQTDFTTSTSGLSRTKFWSAGVVWSDGRRLAVGDLEHDRVLIWNRIPTENGQPADVVVGAPNFTTGPTNVASAATFLGIGGLASDGTSLFVCDIGANRILTFTPFPTSNGASAVGVIGQDSFTAITANDHNQDGVNDLSPTERTLSIPAAIKVQGNRLMVADNDNNRLLIYVSN